MTLTGKPNIEKLKEKNDIYGLIDAFRYSKENEVQEQAKKILVSIGTPVIKPLIRALADEDGWVQTYAGSTLRAIGTPAVEPLIEALKGSNLEIRRQAATVLGEIKEKRAVEPLIETLFDEEDEFIRARSAMALGEIGDEAALEYLKKASTEDKTRHVKEEALYALKKFGDRAQRRGSPPESRPVSEPKTGPEESDETILDDLRADEEDAHLKTWEEENEHFVKEVSRMLEKIEEAQEMEINNKLGREEKDNIRDENEKSYVKIGSALKEPFIQAIEDGNNYVMKEVSDMIQSLDRNNTILLEEEAEGKKREESRKEEPKKRDFDKSNVATYIKDLNDEDKEVRKRAVIALEKARDPRAVDALVKALDDADREIQISAAMALGEQRDLQAIEPLVAFYLKVNTSDYYHIPIKYKGRNIWTVCEAFKRKQFEVEKAIKKIGGPEALKFIEKYKPQNKIESLENAKIWWFRTDKSHVKCAWCSSTIRNGEGYLVESKKRISDEKEEELFEVAIERPDLICERCYNNNLSVKPYRKDNF